MRPEAAWDETEPSIRGALLPWLLTWLLLKPPELLPWLLKPPELLPWLLNPPELPPWLP